jgi:hypothetical protein
MAIALRLREQLVNSASKINTRSQYYGNANPVPVVALRMIYELIALNDCGYINMEFKCLRKLELLANDIVIKNSDICKLRGPSVFYQDRQDNTRILTTSHLGPTVGDGSKYVANGTDTITFNAEDFTNSFSETAKSIQVSTLPAYGTLTLNGVDVEARDIIELDDIEGLLYTRIDDAYADPFYFKTSNNETEKTFSNMATFTVNVDGEINQSATIGDGSTTDEYGVTITFTRAMFTTNTTPAYSDPEGDAAETLKITSLPSNGEIQLNGTAISVNDEFDFTDDIDSGNLTYVPDNAITDAQALDFTFEIADAGSGEFVS